MPTFGEFQQAVAQRIQDSASKVSQASVDGCIEKAIKGRYSQERPLEKIKDIAGDSATFEWEINTTNFPGWVDEASYFKYFEYPSGEKIPVLLDGDDWAIVRISSTVRRVRLRLDRAVSAGRHLELRRRRHVPERRLRPGLH